MTNEITEEQIAELERMQAEISVAQKKGDATLALLALQDFTDQYYRSFHPLIAAARLSRTQAAQIEALRKALQGVKDDLLLRADIAEDGVKELPIGNGVLYEMNKALAATANPETK